MDYNNLSFKGVIGEVLKIFFCNIRSIIAFILALERTKPNFTNFCLTRNILSQSCATFTTLFFNHKIIKDPFEQNSVNCKIKTRSLSSYFSEISIANDFDVHHLQWLCFDSQDR